MKKSEIIASQERRINDLVWTINIMRKARKRQVIELAALRAELAEASEPPITHDIVALKTSIPDLLLIVGALTNRLHSAGLLSDAMVCEDISDAIRAMGDA